MARCPELRLINSVPQVIARPCHQKMVWSLVAGFRPAEKHGVPTVTGRSLVLRLKALAVPCQPAQVGLAREDHRRQGLPCP